MKDIILALATVTLIGGCAGSGSALDAPDAAPAAELAQDGRDIAEAQCAGCHAIGVYGESPNAAAPPFRRILSNYRGEVLEQELIEGIRVAHPMPSFQFNPQGADALIAYLRSIQETQH